MIQSEDFFARKQKEVGVCLNEAQKQAVLHTEGPLLLLASPGSGKTTTTIMRIGYLIEEKGVRPERIKAVTFSKAAATDMKLRFQRFFPQLQQTVDFSTIHSMAFHVVREYFYKQNTPYHIIEGNIPQERIGTWPLKKKWILRQLFQRFNHEKIAEDELEALITYCSFIKNKMVPRAEWDKVACDVPSARQIFQEYENYKTAGTDRLLVDFDDMLTYANEAFLKDPVLLQKYQQKYDYLLTDESQDTSMVQHAIIEKLVQPHKNLYVVADDDQSIYTWRAAEPQYLLNFKQVYPEAAILMMEQNYRSSKEIVETANQFIQQNKHRYPKKMFTENPPSKPIAIKTLADYRLQASYLVEQLSSLDRFSEAAVLYRNNSSSILIVHELDRSGIPFYLKDDDNQFFTHWVVKDLLNFMRLSFNDKRVDILEQIYTKFNLYITKENIAELKKNGSNQSVFDTLLQILGSKRAPQIKVVKEKFQSMQGKSPLEVITIIRQELGYDKRLEGIAKSLKFNKDYLFGILYTLEEIAASLETMEEFAARLKHLEAIMKAAKYKKQEDAVTLSTFHSSKGLEFTTVFIVDLIQGIIPTNDDLEDDLLFEEAVRLFYVAMTRAELNLELVTYKKQFGKTVRPSQFLLDVKRIINPPVQVNEAPRNEKGSKAVIPPNPNAIKTIEVLKTAKIVKHRVFGKGEIVSVCEDLIEITFQRGKKRLAISACLELGLLEYVHDKIVT
ncbi:ATP-dependent helicase [Bacillus rubiinfantis]|uniref:ATP-dependent helicase n=1 Tax=Bacillus rubiinfantis TaxID=1499680 RepID=UPI0005A7378F|nr:ATP-dependent helicase [Bacillus rubiinfantis]